MLYILGKTLIPDRYMTVSVSEGSPDFRGLLFPMTLRGPSDPNQPVVVGSALIRSPVTERYDSARPPPCPRCPSPTPPLAVLLGVGFVPCFRFPLPFSSFSLLSQFLTVVTYKKEYMPTQSVIA